MARFTNRAIPILIILASASGYRPGFPVTPQVTIGAIQAVVKNHTSSVKVTLSPSSGNIPVTLTLSTSHGTGQAKFSDDTTSKIISQTTTIDIKGMTESSALQNIRLAAAAGGQPLAVKNLTVIKVSLKEISFGGKNYPVHRDDRTGPYEAPHWQDNSNPLDGDADDPGDRKFPAAYKWGAKLAIAAKWVITPSGGLNGIAVTVSGDGPGNIDIPATSALVTPGQLSIPSTLAATAFPNVIRIYNPMRISWKISLLGASDAPAGQSSNQVYVPRTDQLLKPYHTLVHLSCKNADGLGADEAKIIDQIWSEFIDCDVRRADENQLGYYKNYKINSATSTELINYQDGQCFAWANFFIDLLKVQGVEQGISKVNVKPRNPQEKFAINSWELTNNNCGKTPDPAYPWVNYALLSGPISATSYKFTCQSFKDQIGIHGQGNDNPAAWFNSHQVVKVKNQYYDPSYGLIYGSLEEMDKVVIGGYIKETKVTVNEQTLGADVNGDGDVVDKKVKVMRYILRNVPKSNNLIAQPVN